MNENYCLHQEFYFDAHEEPDRFRSLALRHHPAGRNTYLWSGTWTVAINSIGRTGGLKA